MLISIIVLAYNTEKYIKECLESIFHLSGSYKIQLIVVDDCSTDGTRQIISQYASKNIICIFNESNEGAYSAFNKAFSFADGDFIARIDSDDCYCCNFLVDAIAVFQKYSHIGAVYGDISIIDANSKVLSKQNNVNRNGLPKMGNELKSLMANYHIPAPTFIARREAWFEALPLPDGIRLFDWYVSLKIARKWD
ncbi:MAG: glycosyltransferase family 2 protein, partial [bacterium]